MKNTCWICRRTEDEIKLLGYHMISVDTNVYVEPINVCDCCHALIAELGSTPNEVIKEIVLETLNKINISLTINDAKI